jgi:peptide/nickel transport system substrate-binding protein
MTKARISAIPLIAALLLSACAPATPRSEGGSANAPRAGSTSSEPRTITMAFRYEKNDLSTKTLSQAGQEYRPLFNAGLVLIDGKGMLQPQLASELPRLNTDSWRVTPDGRMETTWKLKPNLRWHDGQPLTADDYVFAWKAYSARGLGIFSPAPQSYIDEALAPDPQTVIFRWSALYPDADQMTGTEFPPLPRHLLAAALEAFEQDAATRDAFVNHRYWNEGYIGAGPYRLERLDPGTGLEGSAFEHYALGRPKIDRIVARIIGDENTVLSGILADTIQLSAGITIRHEHALVLQREWVPNGRGTVAMAPARLVNNLVQFRPEYQRSPALLDVRVRRALVHGIDRQALNDALFEGQSINPESFLIPGSPSFAEVDRLIAKYPFDPRRTEQLMNEAGFSKDREGLFANAAGERFRPDFQVLTGTQFERGGALMVDTWRRAGIEVQNSVLPAVQVRQNDVRNTFPGISTPGAAGGNETRTLEFFSTGQIGTPANGWVGSNRGGWVNPEYDRLWSAYSVTLDRAERVRQMADMTKLVNEELPGWPIYWDFNVMAFPTSLRGPELGLANTSTEFWSIHEWEVR